MVFMRDLTAAEILAAGASADATEAALDWAFGDGREVRRVRRLPDGGLALDASVGGQPAQTVTFDAQGREAFSLPMARENPFLASYRRAALIP